LFEDHPLQHHPVVSSFGRDFMTVFYISFTALISLLGNMFTSIQVRPRRRRLEAFTTDSKIIRLISRRVAIFPAVAARQIFDGDCDAANRKIISGVIPPNFRPCGFLDKWTEVFPVDKILHKPMPLH